MEPEEADAVYRVVLVDADEEFRALLEVILAFDSHFQIVGAAADGHGGVSLVRRLQPDVVAISLELPDLDAWDAINVLNEESPSTRIVVFASLPDPLTLVDLVGRGAHAYVDKEQAWSDLIPTLISVCHTTSRVPE